MIVTTSGGGAGGLTVDPGGNLLTSSMPDPASLRRIWQPHEIMTTTADTRGKYRMYRYIALGGQFTTLPLSMEGCTALTVMLYAGSYFSGAAYLNCELRVGPSPTPAQCNTIVSPTTDTSSNKTITAVSATQDAAANVWYFDTDAVSQTGKPYLRSAIPLFWCLYINSEAGNTPITAMVVGR